MTDGPDQDGLAKRTTPDLSITRELGVPGTVYSGGNVVERDPVLRQLSGARWRQTARLMRESDATVSACCDVVTMLSRQATWRVDPAEKGDPDAENAAEFVRGALFEDMSHSWGDFLTDALTMVEQGWSYCEVVYKIRRGPEQRQPGLRSRFADGRVGVRKIVGRDQLSLLRWEFDPQGGVRAMVQVDPNAPGVEGIAIPIDRGLLFRTTRERGDPEGRSLLRAAHQSWWRKRNIESIEAVGIERDLTGVPIVYGPFSSVSDPTARAAMEQAAQALATQLRYNEQSGVRMDSAPYSDPQTGQLTSVPMWRMELLASAGTRAVNTHDVLMRYDSQITRRFFADFLMLGQQTRGSYALSKSKITIFAAATGYLLDVVRDTVQRHLLPRLWDLNGLDYAMMPSIEHSSIVPDDLATIAQFVQAMAAGGLAVGQHLDVVNALLDMAGLPEVSEGDPLPDAVAPVALPADPSSPTPSLVQAPSGTDPAAPAGRPAVAAPAR